MLPYYFDISKFKIFKIEEKIIMISDYQINICPVAAFTKDFLNEGIKLWLPTPFSFKFPTVNKVANDK
jgi:hypothetical protein